MIIAIDGTTASGKGTLAKGIARKFGLQRLDTGSLYRAVALAVLDAGDDPKDAQVAELAARGLDLSIIDESRIRTGVVGAAAAVVAAHPGVRQALLEAQQSFAQDPRGSVLDGRDIGTVICPDADVKFFVDADLHTRAERRWRELTSKGENVTLDQVESEIATRDDRDRGRKEAPLVKASDAITIDTSALSIEEMNRVACEAVEARAL